MNENVNERKNIKRLSLIIYAVSAVFLIIAFFTARNVYRMWSWPGADAELVSVAYLAELDDPIDENYKKGNTIRISYNPQNPTKIMRFSFFFSFSPVIWIITALGIMYVARIVWNYEDKTKSST